MSPTRASTAVAVPTPIASGSSPPAHPMGGGGSSAPGSSTGGGFLKRLFGGNGSGTRTARSQSTSAKGKEPETAAAVAPTAATGAVFGVALDVSLRYASVAISQVDDDGKARVYGHIPVVVAKTGLFLKEKGTAVPGIFRVSGSVKRIKTLEQLFDTPPLYGKSMVWDPPYTVHDAASAFRRYLNMLPDPVIPIALYPAFHDALPPSSPMSPGEIEAAIRQYRDLIKSLPASSQHLLFYTLDLLSIFHAKSELNLMPASNLALIFRVGLLRADTGALNLATSNATPESVQGGPSLAAAASAEAAQAMLSADEVERKKSQDVLEFLIVHAASFELELPPHVRAAKAPKRPSGPPSRSSSGTRLASLAAAIVPSRSGRASPNSVPASPKLAAPPTLPTIGPAAEATPIGARADATAQVQSIGRSASQKKKLRRQSADSRAKTSAPAATSPNATSLTRAHTVTTRSPARLTADATVKNQLTAPVAKEGSRPSSADSRDAPRSKGWAGAFKLGGGHRRKSMDAPREQ